jgi:hypothetical protein
VDLWVVPTSRRNALPPSKKMSTFRRKILPPSSGLIMEAVCTSETSVIYETTRRSNPEAYIHARLLENFTSEVMQKFIDTCEIN